MHYKQMSHVITTGRTEFLRIFLEHGGNPDTKVKSDETLLLYALSRRKDDQVQLLLQKGANANLTDNMGRTPLIEALQDGNGHLVKQLVVAGADVNQIGQVKPLAIARLLGNDEISQMLVRRGARERERPPPTNAVVSTGSNQLSSADPVRQRHQGSSSMMEMPPPYEGPNSSSPQGTEKGSV
jgi:ankyrin repeat protein